MGDRVGVISHGELIAEGTVKELRGRGSVLVRAEPLAAARERAEQLVGKGNVEVVDGTLRLASDPAEVPRLNRELVLAGVAVSEVRPLERTLEDVFLGLTGRRVETMGGSYRAEMLKLVRWPAMWVLGAVLLCSRRCSGT